MIQRTLSPSPIARGEQNPPFDTSSVSNVINLNTYFTAPIPSEIRSLAALNGIFDPDDIRQCIVLASLEQITIRQALRRYSEQYDVKVCKIIDLDGDESIQNLPQDAGEEDQFQGRDFRRASAAILPFLTQQEAELFLVLADAVDFKKAAAKLGCSHQNASDRARNLFKRITAIRKQVDVQPGLPGMESQADFWLERGMV